MLPRDSVAIEPRSVLFGEELSLLSLVTLTKEQLLIADRLVELRVLRANGTAFQELFVEVMVLRYPDFRPVKPHGNVGDRKNDGYRSSVGVYYQVYAPEKPGVSITTAVEKLTKDFAGLRDYWQKICPIKGYNFAFNDKFLGAFPEIETALLKLRKEHKLAECRPFLAKDLLHEVSQLSERDLLKITGILPSAEAIEDLDFGVFSEVLRYVNENSQPVHADALLTVPDFTEKIRLNRISAPVAALLTSANLQSGAVETFFAGHSAFSKTVVRDELARIYEEAKASLSGVNRQSAEGDLIFFAILDAIVPAPASKHSQDAAIVLLAYFFESCDIYEDPGDLLLKL